jgi:hypothetical protein
MSRGSCRAPKGYVYSRQELCKSDVHLEVCALRRLRQFLMCGCGHESGISLEPKRLDTSGVASLPSYLDQDGLHGEVTLPLAQTGELVKLDLVIPVSANMSYVCVCVCVCVFPSKTYLAVSLIYAGQVDL